MSKLTERDQKLLRDYHIVDRRPRDPPETWREKLLFHRYLRALTRPLPKTEQR
jgi:hypothetical protein